MAITAAWDNERQPDLSKTSCLYCTKLGHLVKDCRNRFWKEQEQKEDPAQNVKTFIAKTHSLCPCCQRTNQTPKKNWNSPNAVNRPQTFKRHPPSSDDQERPKGGTSTQKTPPSTSVNPFELPRPWLQWADVTTARHYITSDPANNYYDTQHIILLETHLLFGSNRWKKQNLIHIKKRTYYIKRYPNTNSTLHKTLTPRSDRYHKQKSLKRIL